MAGAVVRQGAVDGALDSGVRSARGEVLYDIGANVGTFPWLRAVSRGASVVAFEPGYANFARLCENIQLNECGGAIVPVPLPLSDTTGLLSFKYRSLEPGQSRHALGEAPFVVARRRGGALCSRCARRRSIVR